MALPSNRQALGEPVSVWQRLPNYFQRPDVRKWLIGVGAVGLLALLVWYFTVGNSIPSGGAHRAAAVRVVTVERYDMPVVEHTLGTVIAYQLVQITTRVQGTLEAINFREGQFVRKGDILFQIDPRSSQVALDQARAVLIRDEALLRNAIRDRQRYAALRAQNAISSQLSDTAAASAEALVGTVAADRATVAGAELNLSYTKIRSPVDGKTGPLVVQLGNMVPAGGTSPLVTIAQLQPIKVSFSLPQTDLPTIQARQRVGALTATLETRDAQGRPLSAPVDFISNAVNAQSGTIELRSTFGNTDATLVPGQLTNVTVELSVIPKALIVPRTAINDGPNGSYVYVVANGHAEHRDIQVLFDDGKNVAIVGKVKTGEQVVVEGQLLVVPNGAVRIVTAGTTSDSGHAPHHKAHSQSGSGRP